MAQHGIEVQLAYIDEAGDSWLVPSTYAFYSCPDEFEFKLHRDCGAPVATFAALAEKLAVSADVAMPVVLAAPDWDVGVKAALEAAGLPVVGTVGEAAWRAGHKGKLRGALEAAGFPVVDRVLLTREEHVRGFWLFFYKGAAPS